MFGLKKLKERIERLEQFEKSVCTIIDNYFATNEKHDLKFSTDGSADKFYHFVTSVDEKLKRFSRLEKGIATRDDIIAGQQKKINELTDERDELQVKVIAKNRETARAKATTVKGGKK